MADEGRVVGLVRPGLEDATDRREAALAPPPGAGQEMVLEGVDKKPRQDDTPPVVDRDGGPVRALLQVDDDADRETREGLRPKVDVDEVGQGVVAYATVVFQVGVGHLVRPATALVDVILDEEVVHHPRVAALPPKEEARPVAQARRARPTGVVLAIQVGGPGPPPLEAARPPAPGRGRPARRRDAGHLSGGLAAVVGQVETSTDPVPGLRGRVRGPGGPVPRPLASPVDLVLHSFFCGRGP